MDKMIKYDLYIEGRGRIAGEEETLLDIIQKISKELIPPGPLGPIESDGSRKIYGIQDRPLIIIDGPDAQHILDVPDGPDGPLAAEGGRGSSTTGQDEQGAGGDLDVGEWENEGGTI